MGADRSRSFLLSTLLLTIIRCVRSTDYTTDRTSFDAQAEASSSSFRPFGTLLSSYERKSEVQVKRDKLRKRKYRDPDEDEDENIGEKGKVDGDESVTFEVWKVRCAQVARMRDHD